MPTSSEAIDAAIQEVSTARSAVMKIKATQIRAVDDVGPLKATALSWFNTHRPAILAGGSRVDLDDANEHYTIILEATAKCAARQTYLNALRDAKAALIKVRTDVLSVPAASAVANTDDLAPDFSPLAGNQEIRDILTRRWHECCKCVKADAHLAAIVMMGGLLEALFVARANKLAVKTPLVSAASAPKDKATGKTQNYQEWMLDSYIKVGHELGWITESAKDVADILKEYRNYVHPEKERRHGITLGFNDSSIFWQVTKALVRQLLMSAGSPP